jgi:hypothetical protein
MNIQLIMAFIQSLPTLIKIGIEIVKECEQFAQVLHPAIRATAPALFVQNKLMNKPPQSPTTSPIPQSLEKLQSPTQREQAQLQNNSDEPVNVQMTIDTPVQVKKGTAATVDGAPLTEAESQYETDLSELDRIAKGN